MRKLITIFVGLLIPFSLVVAPQTVHASESVVSGVRFSWPEQVYAPQSATEDEYLIVTYENKSAYDYFTVGFTTQDPMGRNFLFFGAVPGVKSGTKGEIKVKLNYLAFLNVRGPVDYGITLYTQLGVYDSSVSSKSKLTFITEKPKTNASPASTSGQTCTTGGDCKLGDIGPGGGTVVYVATTLQPWGRYIEVAPKTWYRGVMDPQKKPFCPEVSKNFPTLRLSSVIGAGLTNSIEIRRHCPTGAAAMAMAHTGGGLSDWFLPSMDELKEVFYAGQLPKAGSEMYWYWSSTIDARYVNVTGGFIVESLYSSSGNMSGNSSDTNDFRVRPIRYGMSLSDKAEAKAKAEAEAKAKAELSKKTTITCVKGKITKKITATNPKCPKGYKKK
jgi:hypothetical protein